MRFNSEGKIVQEKIDGIGPHRMAHEIGYREIESWLLGLPHGRTTRRQYRAHISNLYNYAIQIGAAGENPVDRVVSIKPDEPPREILTLEQVDALINASSMDALPAIILGLFAGLRPEAEICRLRWEHILLAKETIQTPSGGSEEIYGHIEIRASKVETSKRLVQISPNLYEWLITMRPASGIGPVSVGYDRVNNLINKAAKKAKIQPWPHDVLRHSFSSYHYAAYRNEALTMAQTGARSVTVFRKHYCKPIQQSLGFKYFEIRPSPKFIRLIGALKETCALAEKKEKRKRKFCGYSLSVFK
jgi:integrase